MTHVQADSRGGVGFGAAVDLGFRVQGTQLPLDHGYALFSALSRVLPALHERRDWGVQHVRGAKDGPGVLRLSTNSRLRLRVPPVDMHLLLPLVGHTLDVGGKPLRLLSLEVHPLSPAVALQAPIVIIKNHTEPETFQQAVKVQLQALPGMNQPIDEVGVVVGRRRVMKVSEHTVVGFEVGLDGLSAASSLLVQQVGIGGRRHMGAGIFNPARG